jgi:hypothetical protein
MYAVVQDLFAELEQLEPDERMRGGFDDPAPYDPDAFEHDVDLDTIVTEFERSQGIAPCEDDDAGVPETSDDAAAWEHLQPHLDEPIIPGGKVTARQVAYALYKLKIDGTIHDKVFNSICKLVHCILPEGNHFPGCASGGACRVPCLLCVALNGPPRQPEPRCVVSATLTTHLCAAPCT